MLLFPKIAQRNLDLFKIYSPQKCRVNGEWTKPNKADLQKLNSSALYLPSTSDRTQICFISSISVDLNFQGGIAVTSLTNIYEIWDSSATGLRKRKQTFGCCICWCL